MHCPVQCTPQSLAQLGDDDNKDGDTIDDSDEKAEEYEKRLVSISTPHLRVRQDWQDNNNESGNSGGVVDMDDQEEDE